MTRLVSTQPLSVAGTGLFAQRPPRWSVIALDAATLGVALGAVLVLLSDSDPGSVLWGLVVLPLFLTAGPVLVPHHGVRLVALLALGAWCFTTGFSIGLLLLPSFMALFVALVRSS